ncbi:nucleolar protein dao-5-like isoform X2 [Littorina saxatilis]|uniref:B box-type domain-containing protein n=2 Tax=Littorina saxatilis TaxID=31220 RepID=A0AAN9C2T6_9CAEN
MEKATSKNDEAGSLEDCMYTKVIPKHLRPAATGKTQPASTSSRPLTPPHSNHASSAPQACRGNQQRSMENQTYGFAPAFSEDLRRRSSSMKDVNPKSRHEGDGANHTPFIQKARAQSVMTKSRTRSNTSIVDIGLYAGYSEVTPDIAKPAVKPQPANLGLTGDGDYCNIRHDATAVDSGSERPPTAVSMEEESCGSTAKDEEGEEKAEETSSSIVKICSVRRNLEKPFLEEDPGGYARIKDYAEQQQASSDTDTKDEASRLKLVSEDCMALEQGCKVVFPHEEGQEAAEYTNTETTSEGGNQVSRGNADRDHSESEHHHDAQPISDGGSEEDIAANGSQMSFRYNTSFGWITPPRSGSQCSLEQNKQYDSDGVQSISPQDSRKNSLSDNSESLVVLQTCSACTLPSTELTLMQCFHLVCPSCVLPGKHDRIKCAVCKADQAAPQDGVTLLADMFPGFLDVLNSLAQAADDTTHDQEQETAETSANCDQSFQKEEATEPSLLKKKQTGQSGTNGVKDTASSANMHADAQESQVRTGTANAKSQKQQPETEENRVDRNTSEMGSSVKCDKTSPTVSSATAVKISEDSTGSKDDNSFQETSQKGIVEASTVQTTAMNKEKKTTDKKNATKDTSADKSTTDMNHKDEASCTESTTTGVTHNEPAKADENKESSSSKENVTANTTDIESDKPGGNESSSSSAVTKIQRQTCGACREEADTQHACVTCGGIPLCAGCHTAHLTLPVTRSHQFVTVTSTSLSPVTLISRHQPVCPTHGQDLAVQCCTCGVFLCHRCVAPAHTTHKVRDLGNLYHIGKKQFSGLQRSIKQHLLSARSSRRSLDEQIQRVEKTELKVCKSIRASAQRHIDRIECQVEELSHEVSRQCKLRRCALDKTKRNVTHVQDEGRKLRGVLVAISDDTPHLTSLILHNSCQARFDRLRHKASLRVEEFPDLVFCEDVVLEGVLAKDRSLGTIQTLAPGLPDTMMHVLSAFKTEGEVSSVAATPFSELVITSTALGTCRVWDQQGVLLYDVSRHVTQPRDVRVTPGGVIVVLGSDTSSGKGRAACLTLLSPAGSLLSRLPLSSEARLTRIDCPSDTHILVSDEADRTVTLYALQQSGKISLRPLRKVHHEKHLKAPRHVAVNITGDWLVNERGYYLRLVSPEDHVATVLSEDEPEAALHPPRSSRYSTVGSRSTPNRLLTSVCCDSRGRMLAADAGKNGVYITTTGPSGTGERHFVSLHEVTPSSHVTAMAVDKHDRIIVGMSDGIVRILKIGSE